MHFNRSLVPTVFISLAVGAAIGFNARASAQAVHVDNAGDVSVYFSPNGGAESAAVDAIEHAQRSILVQAYSFTAAPIYKALATAHARGVDVRVLVDKEAAGGDFRGQGARYDIAHGVPLWVDYIPGKGIAHNKVIIIDGATVITGSFNWSRAADTTNAENLVIFRNNPAIARAYTNNWMTRAQHAVAYANVPASASASEF
jgi:phosphatidylserine/phosphatidylglycerophosphate/cardiolipin synthase-like enzyme